MNQLSPQDGQFRLRIIAAAERVIKEQSTIGLLDVLQAAGFLYPGHVEQWRRGHEYYEFIHAHVQCGPPKLRRAIEVFLEWAAAKNLTPMEATFTRRSPSGMVPLKFTQDDDPAIVALYTRQFARAGLSEKQQARAKEKLEKPDDLVAFISVSDKTVCSECGEEIGKGNFMTLEKQQPLCMTCADMDHLVFLPSGDVALTRRAKKHSPLSAIVLRFNRPRKRYERQGLIVTEDALARAEDECIADADERAARRQVAAAARGVADQKFVAAFTSAIRTQFPACPPHAAAEIAAHAALRGSGRVGRSAAGRELDPGAVKLAVIAHIRHLHTNYDKLLMEGMERQEARERIRDKVQDVLRRWEQA
jgi:hypothetical protein